MIVNFKIYEISRSIHKLIQIFILIKKKAKTHQPGFVAETNLDPSPGEVTRTALFTLQEADGTTF
jgi:hypothetical protein